MEPLVLSTLAQTIIIVIGQIVVACIVAYSTIKIAQLKSHINSRMDNLLKITSDSEFAKGKLAGKLELKELQEKRSEEGKE